MASSEVEANPEQDLHRPREPIILGVALILAAVTVMFVTWVRVSLGEAALRQHLGLNAAPRNLVGLKEMVAFAAFGACFKITVLVSTSSELEVMASGFMFLLATLGNAIPLRIILKNPSIRAKARRRITLVWNERLNFTRVCLKYRMKFRKSNSVAPIPA